MAEYNLLNYVTGNGSDETAGIQAWASAVCANKGRGIAPTPPVAYGFSAPILINAKSRWLSEAGVFRPIGCDGFHISAPDKVVMDGFEVDYDNPIVGTSAFLVDAPAGQQNVDSRLNDCKARGASVGYSMLNANGFVLDGCVAESWAAAVAHILINVSGQPDQGDSTIQAMTTRGPVSMGSVLYKSGGGLKIIGGKYAGSGDGNANVGIYLSLDTHGVSTGDLQIIGANIEGFNHAVALFRATGNAGTFQRVALAGCVFGALQRGVWVHGDAGQPWLKELALTGNVFELGPNALNGVLADNNAVSGAIVDGNSFYGPISAAAIVGMTAGANIKIGGIQ